MNVNSVVWVVDEKVIIVLVGMGSCEFVMEIFVDEVNVENGF